MSERGAPGAGPPALLVLMPAAGGPGTPAPDTVVGGLGLLARLVRVGHRAGFDRITVHPALTRFVRPEDGGTARLDEHAPGPAPAGPTRLVMVAASVVPTVAWLRAVRTAPVASEELAVDPAGVCLVETSAPHAVLAAAASAASLSDLARSLGTRFRASSRALPEAGRMAVASTGHVGRAESWLLRGLVKEHEGFMSRHVERRISLAISRRLAPTRITPNAMTVVSLAVGLASAGFFLSSRPGWQVAGALIFLAHSILDGCDGELARLKLMESPGGARLDFWGDNVVHVAVWGSMAVGWSLASGSAWPLWLGALAIGATLTAATVLARRARGAAAGGQVVDALANRDFIYLILGLAAFGKAAWFLVFVGIGTPVFIALALRGRRP